MPIPLHHNLPPVDRTTEGFAPVAALENALRYWWVPLLCALLGAAVGWAFHAVKPPVYEAVGSLSASMDFVRTGPLTQYEEDVALNAVGDLAGSAMVLEAVAAQARAEGLPVDLQTLQRTGTVERKLTSWDIRVRHTDPQTAQRVAEIWVRTAQSTLEESYRHTLMAEGYRQLMQQLERCLGQTAAAEPSTAVCSRERLGEIQSDLKQAGEGYAVERAASYNISPNLMIGDAGTASLRDGPVRYGQGELVLAGSMIGLLVGLWLAQSSLPRRLGHR